GVLGVAWCAVFWWWFRDRPEQKPGVNPAELALIHGDAGPPEAAHARVPWLRLLGNANLWVLCLMYFCAAYGWYFNITYLPGYLKTEYHVSPGDKWSPRFWTFRLLAGMPLLLRSAACRVGGLLTDAFIRRTGNRKWGRRLFGVVGHSVCALCYFLSIYARDPWLFVLAIAFAAFWNDITMGSAWASCLDIGGRYSGIVAGCMNTIGNLGGAAAGYMTGWVLDAHNADARAEATRAAVEAAGPFLATATDATSLLTALDNTSKQLEKLNQVKATLLDATTRGWEVNFLIFGLVYVVAMLLWLR